MNSISLHRDRNQVGSKNLKPTFTRNEFVRSFFTLLRDTGIYFTNATNDISQNDFKGGSALFCFDLSADRKSDKNFELVKNSNIRLEITFHEPLTESVNVIVYSEYQNLIEIDKHRIFFWITVLKLMNTQEINRLLFADQQTKDIFCGCYAKDDILNLFYEAYSKAYIVNTHDRLTLESTGLPYVL